MTTQPALREPEPPATGPAPRKITYDEFADWLHAPAPAAIPPGAGRGSRRHRLFKPVVDLIVSEEYL